MLYDSYFSYPDWDICWLRLPTAGDLLTSNLIRFSRLGQLNGVLAVRIINQYY